MKPCVWVMGILAFASLSAQAVDCNREIAEAFKHWARRTAGGDFVVLQPRHLEGVQIAREISEILPVKAIRPQSNWNRVLYPLSEGAQKEEVDSFIKGRVTSRVPSLKYGNKDGYCYGLREPMEISLLAMFMLDRTEGPYQEHWAVQFFGAWVANFIQTDKHERDYLERSRAFFQSVIANTQERKLSDGEIIWLRVAYSDFGTMDFGFSFSASGTPRLLIIFDSLSDAPLPVAKVEFPIRLTPDNSFMPPF